MALIPWLIIASIVLPVGYLAWVLFTADRKGALAIQTNLGSGLVQGNQGGTTQVPALLVLSKKLTPGPYEAKLDNWLAKAGRPISMPLERLLVSKPLAAIAGAFVGFLLFTLSPTSMNIGLALFLTTFLYFVPDLLIYNQGVKRQSAIELELPNTLDQMLISVEAGLGFESAMARSAANGRGPLAQELVRTLQDIQVGRPRQEAYEALAERCTVPDLRSFVRAVVQADKYGIGVAKVLRAQARQARVKRRQRAEEKAMKLPVKVLFPLILCIFPVMFIILLGPAVINIIQALFQ